MSMRKGFESKVDKSTRNKVGGVSTHPEKGTKRYAENEKIINSNSALKKARDVAQGLQKPDSAYGDTSHGKGSAMRGSLEDYKAGYDQIKWTKQEFKEKPKFKTRINGVVVSDPENDNE